MDLRPTLTATNVGTQKDKHEVLKIDDDDLYDLDASIARRCSVFRMYTLERQMVVDVEALKVWAVIAFLTARLES